MKSYKRAILLIAATLFIGLSARATDSTPVIPLPEHPRPDFERADWLNLNGPWRFQFDKEDVGLKKNWQNDADEFDKTITVPFPWGSPLSGVADEAQIAWYSRSIGIPEEWKGKRIFFVVGACDYETTVWLDGKEIGVHRGGYTPFEFELTSHIRPGQPQTLVLRVDDTDEKPNFKLFGKQGYGNARGIWQTPYLEARGATHLKSIQFSPDIDAGTVSVSAQLSQGLSATRTPITLTLRFKTGEPIPPPITIKSASGTGDILFVVPMANARLWSLEDPFLYEVELELTPENGPADKVSTYFGMRKISVMDLPGTDHPYIALNNKPIYLQTTLDQAYHPEGFYTFPSDDFMRDEILRSRRIGLNGMRIHVKIGIPRKLYWADRLGMLIMADVPNSWGQPDARMRREIDHALRGMIARDYNHPSIFSWVIFNETWGLKTEKKGYLPETQKWVADMYQLAKKLDPTRLVEDNSPCNNDHVITDINSWHSYLPGYGWEKQISDFESKTFPGSEWNYIGEYKQANAPLFNSECGNVWGYQGSAGDGDWSWDYHLMINAFRRHPKTCGWLYTEHHDVINEWNGYYRFDRSEKFTGMDEIVDGMSLLDLHAPYYLATGEELCQAVEPGATVSVPLWVSVMTDFGKPSKKATIRATLTGWDTLGQPQYWGRKRQEIELKPWMAGPIDPLEIEMPSTPGLAILALRLEDASGKILQRNFTTFVVEGQKESDDSTRLIRVAPKDFAKAEWSRKQWNILDGLKVNGAGSGFFEYTLPWPEGLKPADIADATFVFEASAKQLFGKDRAEGDEMSGDYMLGGGSHDPSRNPNAYPMTDTLTYPGAVRVRVAGHSAGVFDLADDPADHRGILSWFSQKRDKQLREAGSYGYLIQATVSPAALEAAAKAGQIAIRLEVDAAQPNGLALYGSRFGRYPLDPTLVLKLKD